MSNLFWLTDAQMERLKPFLVHPEQSFQAASGVI